MARVTIGDIAKAAGVGRATVARALAHGSVSPETRARILEIAKRLDYKPDPLLSTLGRNRWRTMEAGASMSLGFVYQARTGANRNFPMRQCRLLRPVAEQQGYLVHDYNALEYPSGEALSEVLFNRGVRGVILSSNLEQPVDLRWDRFSTIAIGEGPAIPPVHCVRPGSFASTMLAWSSAIEAGYRRIAVALLVGPSVLPADSERIAASLYAQRSQLKPTERIPPFIYARNSDAEAIRFRRWMTKHRPEVVIACNLTIAHWLKQDGLNVPKDIALVLLDPAHRAPYAGVANQQPLIAELAIYLLDSLIRKNEQGLPRVVQSIGVRGEWRAGFSLPEAHEQVRSR